MEIIIAVSVLGVILSYMGLYAQKQAVIKSKEHVASKLVHLTDNIQRYSSYRNVNRLPNPLLENNYNPGELEHVFPDDIAGHITDRVFIGALGLPDGEKVDWLKQPSCFDGSTQAQGLGYVPEGANLFLQCSEGVDDLWDLEYAGTALRFRGPAASRDSVGQSISYYVYSGSPLAAVVDIASFVQAADANQGLGIAVEFSKVIISGPNDNPQLELVAVPTDPNQFSYSYSDMLELDEATRNLFFTLTDGQRIALTLSTQSFSGEALLIDGSNEMNSDADICWSGTTNTSERCMTVAHSDTEDEVSLDLTDFNLVDTGSIAFRDGDETVKSRTPVQASFQTFAGGGAGHVQPPVEIDMITCPTGFNNKFSAVVSSFSSAGVNAEFTEESKQSDGTLNDGLHALVSAVTIDWEKVEPVSERKWLVSAAIGIENDVLDAEPPGGNSNLDQKNYGSVLRNPKSLSFIAFQWCEEPEDV